MHRRRGYTHVLFAQQANELRGKRRGPSTGRLLTTVAIGKHSVLARFEQLLSIKTTRYCLQLSMPFPL